MKRRDLLVTGAAAVLGSLPGKLGARSSGNGGAGLADAGSKMSIQTGSSSMPGFISRDPRAQGLIRIGDEAIAKESAAQLRAYFSDDFVFHGSLGDLTYEQLSSYFASLRAAFADFSIVREQIVVEGDFAAARNTFSGRFTNVFTQSPVGAVQPNGKFLTWEVINTFRFGADGRLVEEWAQTDYRGFLTKLGVGPG